MEDLNGKPEKTDRDKDYEFIQETIKKRPVNKKRYIKKTLFTIFLAVLFGCVASVVFVYFRPWISDVLQVEAREDTEEVEVRLESAQDEYPVKEEAPVSDKTTGNMADDKTDTEQVTETEKKDSENKTDETAVETAAASDVEPSKEPAAVEISLDQSKEDDLSPDNNASGKDPEDASVTQKKGDEKEEAGDAKDLETVYREIEISDYTTLYKKIGAVADSVKDSMVTVAGISSDTDWFMNSYESNDSTAGLILADNGKELLILTRTSVLKNADSIQVTFSSGEQYNAFLKTSDNNTNLSVIAIPMARLHSATTDTMKRAELGNSRVSNIKGKPVIAIGDPLGVSDSMAIGQITSNAVVLDMKDSNAGILTTDIYGSSKASGILCDFDGKVLGIICQDGSTIDAKNLIRAYSISDLKDRIEKILNGQDIAFLGIKGTDVTEEVNRDLNIPMGAYVKEVVTDSPAMKAGIQNGDVIVKIGTSEIKSFDNFKSSILKFRPGEIITVTVKRLGREAYVDISYEIELDTL
ncbi:MAG: PDZ domain-containing protein [Lachnospiraceae bacterium]|nr:PDZ domain-containing protein [Lachnospiraceae bacterium]